MGYETMTTELRLGTPTNRLLYIIFGIFVEYQTVGSFFFKLAICIIYIYNLHTLYIYIYITCAYRVHELTTWPLGYLSER